MSQVYSYIANPGVAQHCEEMKRSIVGVDGVVAEGDNEKCNDPHTDGSTIARSRGIRFARDKIK
jgi:hypothetical protein